MGGVQGSDLTPEQRAMRRFMAALGVPLVGATLLAVVAASAAGAAWPVVLVVLGSGLILSTTVVDRQTRRRFPGVIKRTPPVGQ